MLNPRLLLAGICSIIQGLGKFGCGRENNNGMACRVCVSSYHCEMWKAEPHRFRDKSFVRDVTPTVFNQFNLFIHLALHAVTLWATQSVYGAKLWRHVSYERSPTHSFLKGHPESGFGLIVKKKLSKANALNVMKWLWLAKTKQNIKVIISP